MPAVKSRHSLGLRILFAAHPQLLAPVLQIIHRIIARLLKMLTRQGYLVEEQGMTYMADIDPDNPLRSLQAASCTYRIAFGPRAGQKVLTLGTVAGRDEKTTPARCAAAHGFSLHAGVRCGAHQRKELERLCRYITRPAIANERLKRNGAGDVVLQLKSADRDGTTHIKMSPLEFMQRLAALVPRPRLHLIRFHGVLAEDHRRHRGARRDCKDTHPSGFACARAAALTGAAAGAVPGGLILKVTTVLQWA